MFELNPDECYSLLVIVCISVYLCVCVSAEISVVLKVDNRIVGRSNWRPLGNEACGQSFSIELERVSGFYFNRRLKLLLSQRCIFQMFLQ